MKHILVLFTTLILLPAIMYFWWAIGAGTFYYTKWDAASRSAYALFAGAFSISATLIYVSIYKMEKQNP